MKIAAAILVAASVLAPPPLLAAQREGSQPLHSRPTTIVVAGSGSESRAPDTATVSAQVTTSDPAAAASLSRNNTLYDAIRQKLAAAGVAESAIHTQSFSLNYVAPQTEANAYDPPHTGYVTTRSLTIDVPAIDRAGSVIDAATAAGATDIGGVQFGLRDRKAALGAALAAAVRDARAQADALAGAAGLHVVRVLQMSTVSSDVSPPAPRLMRAALASTPTEIAPGGPVEIGASVTVTYEVR